MAYYGELVALHTTTSSMIGKWNVANFLGFVEVSTKVILLLVHSLRVKLIWTCREVLPLIGYRSFWANDACSSHM